MKKLPDQVKKVAGTVTRLIVPMALVMTLFFIVGRNWLPTIFSSDQEVRQMAGLFLIILGLYQLPDALQIVYSAAVRGVADVKIPMYLTIISQIIITLPASYMFAFIFQYHQIGIWFGFPLGLTISFVFLFLRFKKVTQI